MGGMADGTTRDALIFVAGLLVVLLLLATVVPRMPWLTDWRLARRYPWRARIGEFVAFTLMTPMVAALAAPDGHWLQVLAAAPVVGVLGVLACEPALRRGSWRRGGN
jgi:hypothetical protein